MLGEKTKKALSYSITAAVLATSLVQLASCAPLETPQFFDSENGSKAIEFSKADGQPSSTTWTIEENEGIGFNAIVSTGTVHLAISENDQTVYSCDIIGNDTIDIGNLEEGDITIEVTPKDAEGYISFVKYDADDEFDIDLDSAFSWNTVDTPDEAQEQSNLASFTPPGGTVVKKSSSDDELRVNVMSYETMPRGARAIYLDDKNTVSLTLTKSSEHIAQLLETEREEYGEHWEVSYNDKTISCSGDEQGECRYAEWTDDDGNVLSLEVGKTGYCFPEIGLKLFTEIPL